MKKTIDSRLRAAERILDRLRGDGIRVRWIHPGNKPRGEEYRFCIICGGEWRITESPAHEELNGHECPVFQAYQHLANKEPV